MTTTTPQSIAHDFVDDFEAHLLIVTQGGLEVPDFDARIDRAVAELAEFCDQPALEELATTARTIIATLANAVEAGGGGGVVRRHATLFGLPRVRAMAEAAVAMGDEGAPLRAAVDAANAAVAAARANLAQDQADLDEAIVSADVERVLALRVLVQVTGPAAVAAATVDHYDALIALTEAPLESLAAQEQDARAAAVAADEAVAALEAELQAARDHAYAAGNSAAGAERARTTVVESAERIRVDREAIAVEAARERTAAMRRLAGEPAASDDDQAAAAAEASEIRRRTSLEAGATYFRTETASAFSSGEA